MFRVAFVLLTIVAVPPWGAATERRLPPRQAPFAKGFVEKIELVSKSLTLQTRTGLETYSWDERSLFFRDRQRIAPAQLQRGDLVALRYVTVSNAPPVIQRLKVLPPTPTTASP